MPYVDKQKQRQAQAEWARRNRTRTGRRRSKQMREIIDSAKKGGCIRCGEKDIVCLDLHHRNPSEKSFTIGKRKAVGAGIQRLKDEIAKCDVVCANCHRKLHASEGHPESESNAPN